MKCPHCASANNHVIDSRLSKEGDTTRRRRQCDDCQGRFTTYERIEEIFPQIIKKDGRREPYDRKKVMLGVQKACEKRPVSMEALENLVHRLEQDLQGLGEKEIPSTEIGERIMTALHELDQVAYVRFASVYREFKDINAFMEELSGLLTKKKSPHV